MVADERVEGTEPEGGAEPEAAVGFAGAPEDQVKTDETVAAAPRREGVRWAWSTVFALLFLATTLFWLGTTYRELSRRVQAEKAVEVLQHTVASAGRGIGTEATKALREAALYIEIGRCYAAADRLEEAEKRLSAAAIFVAEGSKDTVSRAKKLVTDAKDDALADPAAASEKIDKALREIGKL